MAPTKLHFGYVDHSNENCGPKMYIEELDNSNFDDIFSPTTGHIDAIKDVLDIATDCVSKASSVSIPVEGGTGIPPSTVTAQREIAVRVTYRDQVNGKTEHMDIPGPKVAFYPPTGTDVIPLENTIAAQLVIALELHAVSQDGNSIFVTGMRLVGRNN